MFFIFNITLQTFRVPERLLQLGTLQNFVVGVHNIAAVQQCAVNGTTLLSAGISQLKANLFSWHLEKQRHLVATLHNTHREIERATRTWVSPSLLHTDRISPILTEEGTHALARCILFPLKLLIMSVLH